VVFSLELAVGFILNKLVTAARLEVVVETVRVTDIVEASVSSQEWVFIQYQLLVLKTLVDEQVVKLEHC